MISVLYILLLVLTQLVPTHFHTMVKTRSRTRDVEQNDGVRKLDFISEVSEDEDEVEEIESEPRLQGPELVVTDESGDTDSDETRTSWLVFVGASVFIVCSIGIASAAFLYSWISQGSADDNSVSDYRWTYSRRFGIIAFLGCVLVSALLGLGCCFFSYTITYFDSMQPGHIPPSPMSPHTLRKRSGHDFHTGYAMSVLNGAAFFSYCLWSLRSYFWAMSES